MSMSKMPHPLHNVTIGCGQGVLSEALVLDISLSAHELSDSSVVSNEGNKNNNQALHSSWKKLRFNHYDSGGVSSVKAGLLGSEMPPWAYSSSSEKPIAHGTSKTPSTSVQYGGLCDDGVATATASSAPQNHDQLSIHKNQHSYRPSNKRKISEADYQHRAVLVDVKRDSDSLSSCTVLLAGGDSTKSNHLEEHHNGRQRQQQLTPAAIGMAPNQRAKRSARNNRADVVHRVLRHMRGYPEDTAAQLKGMKAICELLIGNRKSRSPIAASGGAEAVLVAMKNHPREEEIQALGCLVIGNLATNNLENRTAIAARGIEAVISAMRENRTTSAIQLNGCYALGSLAEKDSQNQATICALGGVEHVINVVIRDYASRSRIHGAASCNTLGNIASHNKENKLLIASLGGIESVLGVMKSHPSDQDVQQYGIAALGRLIECCPANMETLVANEGVPDILKSMLSHSSHQCIQDNACIALGHLAGERKEYRTSLTDLGAHYLIQQAQGRHPTDAKDRALAQILGGKQEAMF